MGFLNIDNIFTFYKINGDFYKVVYLLQRNTLIQNTYQTPISTLYKWLIYQGQITIRPLYYNT